MTGTEAVVGARSPHKSPEGPFTPGISDGEPYKLYLLTNQAVLAKLKMRPFDIRIEPVDFCAASFRFRDSLHPVPELLELFRLAHARSSVDAQRVLPRWMIVDLLLMASAVLMAVAGQDQVITIARELERGDDARVHGLGRDRAAALRDLLKVAQDQGYEGPLPVAGYAAIPTPAAGRWVGGSLWWSLVPGKKLGYSVRRIALECYRAQHEVGVTQFDNVRALSAQRNFGELRVTHTLLAAHQAPGTFVYDVDLTSLPPDGSPAGREVAGAHPILDSYTVNLADHRHAAELQRIQQAIDTGAVYYLQPPGGEDGSLPTLYTTGHQEQRAAIASVRSGSHLARTRADQHLTDGIGQGSPYQPFIISNASMFENLDLAPFGINLQRIDFCAKTAHAAGHHFAVPELMKLLSRAITLSYSDSGLGTPSWAMLELALMSSAVVLVMADQDYLTTATARLAREPVTDHRRTRLIPLAEDDRDRIRNANSLRLLLEMAKSLGYNGPLPIAGYAAAATPCQGRWVGWSLWSLVPGAKLGYTVKRLGLACYGVERQTAVIQFHMARGLDVITKFGDLRITTVDVGPHPARHAFSYEIDVSKLPADGSPFTQAKSRRVRLQLDPDHAELPKQLADMQRELEHGARYYILSRSVGLARSPLIPICRKWALHRWVWYGGKSELKHLREKLTAMRRGLSAKHESPPEGSERKSRHKKAVEGRGTRTKRI